MALIECLECGNSVSDRANSCPKCGAPTGSDAGKIEAMAIDNSIRLKQIEASAASANKPSGGTAAVLSFVIPGSGQLYKGSVLAGMMWFLFVVIGYFMFVFPGVILHIMCVIDAASDKSQK